ncbi:hypothetical protein SPRG_20294 [Saprolegnia parasitica CBS 223.65]|uniref:CHY-type domain-containing protein n=1 Tax=Saprolegnia parasitica (strain CBS 223.65) TaxID=695850 RepID=A0A067CBK2_SAPPC|nr:hypothetical protein SPRG_20294 [Saprolegnia parasitica CBS 223.65]KDO28134.1 hypothetical protein SPRG_20294 [Saprolegnia parasitica CBS 223.65]|eukprot:XP_012201272.1 hypothetical protein SPRG_20294 [Saprolegnia parasitica CBS 223.65]
MASWLETLRSLTSDVERELFSVLRRYGRPEDCTPEHVVAPCTLALRLHPSDPEFPFALANGLEIYVAIPVAYPREAATFRVHCDVAGFDALFSARIASALDAAMADCVGHLVLRKLLTWLDNHLKELIMPPKPAEATGDHAAAYGDAPDVTTTATEGGDAEPRAANGNDTAANQCDVTIGKGDDNEEAKCSECDGESESDGDAKGADDEVDGTLPVCKFFLAGNCRRGDHCTFTHATSEKKKKKRKRRGPSKAVCRQFLDGKCRRGAKCRYTHPPPATATDVVIEDDDNTTSAKEQAETLAPLPEDWSVDQQHALDAALKQFPVGCMDTKPRWEAIAACVPHKSLSDCVKRFKYLTALVKASTRHVEPPPPASDKDDDIDEDEHAKHDETRDARIVPAHARVKLDLVPDVSAWHIDLGALFLYQIDTVQLHAVSGRFQCLNCPLSFLTTLSLDAPSYKKWCPRCSLLHTIEFRPILVHGANSLAANMSSTNCALVDVSTPLVCLALCAGCGVEGLLSAVPRIRAEASCRGCHAKMALECKAATIVKPLSAPDVPVFDQGKKTKKTKALSENVLVVGQPLPNEGKCSHYGKSKRWFRFQCCGTAYACDICHSESSCHQATAGVFASRFICGLCSREHPTSLKECPCGNAVGAAAVKVHWEGGKGCRSQATMAATDKHKFRGLAKTQSQKCKRVGLEGKLRRERKLEKQHAA